jgi:hypothetical protein
MTMERMGLKRGDRSPKLRGSTGHCRPESELSLYLLPLLFMCEVS